MIPYSRVCSSACSRAYLKSASRRSLSRSSSRSRPVTLTERRMPAVTMPMITTTTRISTRVKPAPRGKTRNFAGTPLVADIPVADVGIDAIATGGTVSSEAEEVVLLAVRARVDVLVVVPPRVLADALQVAARAPVLDRRVGRLRHERLQALLGGRILRVVEPEHGERGLQALDVRLRLGDARFVHSAHDLGHDDRRQQADDDHHHHDLDQGEPPCTQHPASVDELSANLKCVAHAC